MYKDVIDKEAQLILQCYKAPDSPTLLYMFHPPDDALPHFYPALFPNSQVPVDHETNVQIVDKMKAWRFG